MKLPPMPEIEQRHEPEWEPPAVFTRDEMDAYGAACYAAGMSEVERLLQDADTLFAHHCKDATAWNWLDDVRAALSTIRAAMPPKP